MSKFSAILPKNLGVNSALVIYAFKLELGRFPNGVYLSIAPGSEEQKRPWDACVPLAISSR